MFALFKRKNPYEPAARDVYAAALAQAREPAFYTAYGVPDTFDGRFEMLLVHVFLVVNRMKDEVGIGEDFNQALFDVTFKDMDQTLRELGIGDMGIPKHMRRMMLAFNGRMHAYADALDNGFMRVALKNNLYGTLEKGPPAEAIEMMDVYIKASVKAIKAREIDELLSGEHLFIRN